MSDLKEMLTRPLLFGIGAAALTGEKLRQLVDQSVVRGEMSREEGRTFMSDFKARAEEERQNLETRINDQVRKSLQNAGLATKSDLELLRARLDALENRLARMEHEAIPELVPTQETAVETEESTAAEAKV
jgi:polyhydroxyalkanoate synthesis regulator phasin